MLRQQLGRSHLIVPIKAAGAVGGELDVVRRIGVDECVRFDLQCIEIATGKKPVLQNPRVVREVFRVGYRSVSAERDIKLTTTIEATETIEAGAIEIVEELRRLRRLRLAVSYQLIEPSAMAVETCFVVLHLDCNAETALQLPVKVYQVRIDVV